MIDPIWVAFASGSFLGGIGVFFFTSMLILGKKKNKMKGNITVTGYPSDKTPMPSTIVFQVIDDGVEMLRITQDGFYVRGKKIPQDDTEASAVYEAFVSWLRTAGEEETCTSDVPS